MISSGAIGLSFVMVSNTWTRISLEEKVVGSSTLVLAFTRCASTCVCRCWSWARFKGVNDEFFTTPVGEEFSEPYDYITGFIVTNSTWKWASPERCHRGKHVYALRWHVHSHSNLHRGHAGHIESLFLSLDLLTGMMLNRKHPFWRQVPVVHKKVFQCDPLITPESIRADGCSSRSFLFRNTRRACSFAAQLIDVSSFSS